MKRRTRPTEPLSDDIRTLMQEMLERLAALSNRCGVSQEEFADFATQASRKRAGRNAQVPKYALDCVLYAAHTLTLWHTDPAMLNEQGHPRPLPLRGTTSVESLAGTACPSVPAAAIVEHLIHHKTITRDGHNWRPNGDRVRFAAGSPEQSLHGLVILRGLLRTLERNTTAAGRPDAFFELHAKNGHIPLRDKPVVMRNARRNGHKFLSDLDADMQRRANPSLPESRKAHLSVGVYVYEEDVAPPSRTRRTRKRSEP